MLSIIVNKTFLQILLTMKKCSMTDKYQLSDRLLELKSITSIDSEMIIIKEGTVNLRLQKKKTPKKLKRNRKVQKRCNTDLVGLKIFII